MRKYIISALITFGSLFGLLAQDPTEQDNNPFDLIPRLEKPDELPAVSADSAVPDSQNPFDIINASPEVKGMEATASPLSPVRGTSGPANQLRKVKLTVILGILILLAFLVTFLRSLVNKSFLAFFNDNVMSELFRDQESRGAWPFLMLYSLFFLNAGTFIFFLINYFGFPVDINPLPLAGICIAGVFLFFLAKHFILWFLGGIFQIERETSRYNFMIIIFGIVIGLFLIPVNIFLAYASPEIKTLVVKGSLFVLAGIYAFLYLRGLLIANKFLVFHKFHFLLYICTVELAPVLFLIKLFFKEL